MVLKEKYNLSFVFKKAVSWVVLRMLISWAIDMLCWQFNIEVEIFEMHEFKAISPTRSRKIIFLIS